MTVTIRIINEGKKVYGEEEILIDSDPIGTVTVRQKEFDSFDKLGEFIKRENVVCEISTSTLTEYDYDLIIKEP